jgi:uncharacterized repeat protein (TIGR02543 family)
MIKNVFRKDGFHRMAVLYAAVVTLGLLFSGCEQPTDGGGSKPSQYTITFDSHNGTEVPPITDNAGTAVGKPADPARNGYTFTGWYSAASGGTVYTWPHTLTGNVTIHAQWTAITYTVEYNANGGSGTMGPSTHTYDAELPLTANGFTKSGHFFAVWNTQEGGGGTSYNDGQSVSNLSSTQGDTVTLYAQWTTIIYTVTFESHSGSAVTAVSGASGTQTTKPADPTRNGYTFQGWYNVESGGTPYTWPHTLAADVTMHAQWTAIDYTITYHLDGGSNNAANPANYTIASPAITLAAPTRTGYTFGGWYSDAEFTTPVTGISSGNTGNKTFYTQWTATTYTVAYNSNGGDGGATAPSTHIYGQAKNLTTNGFTRTGYTFAVWNTQESGGGTSYNDGQSVSNLSSTQGATVTLYAQWTTIIYTVTFESHSGSAVTAVSGAAGTQAIKPTDPTLNGYTFQGWYTAESGGTPYTWPHTLAADVTMHAQWTAIDYTITYHLDGGSNNAANPANYTIASPVITLAAPTRTGYTFGGWYSDSALTTVVTSIPMGSTGNKTFHAKWTANIYTVAYDKNAADAVGTTASSTHTYGQAKNLTANGFTRTGYTFAGWAASAGGSVIYADSASVENLTTTNGATVNLFAQWTVVNYTITYNLDGGSNNAANPADYTITSLPLTLADPTRTGYTFGGWYRDSGLTTSVTGISSGSTENKTFYAKWTANTYTVEYNANGGDGGATASSVHTYDQASDLTANGFTRTGYDFAGWAASAGGSVSYADSASVENLTTTNGATVNLFAQWTVVNYTITYNLDGGSNNAANPANYTIISPAITLAAPSRTGYIFGGWYSDVEFATPVTGISSGSTGNKTFYAQWTAITYTVAYNSNGGDGGATASSSHTYDQARSLTANGFTRTGYTFAGWGTNMSGTTITYTDSQSVTNLTSISGGTVTLYARWTANTYTVAYYANGGDGGATASSSHTYDQARNLTANGFTRTGFTFGGWNTLANGNGTSYTNSQSVTNLTTSSGGTVDLYAQWQPDVPVNISVWVNDDGDILVSGDDLTISKSGAGGLNDDFTVTVESAYSGVQWYLNGFPITGTQGTAQSITISAMDYDTKTYVLGVTVAKDGISYSTDLRFTVTN